MGKNFMYVFKVRTIWCLIFICSLMLLCFVRVLAICNSFKETNLSQNTLTMEIENTRGGILDCNGDEIVLMKPSYAIIFLPCEQAIMRFISIAEKDEKETGLNKLKNNKPTLIVRNQPVKGIGIYSYSISKRNLDDISIEHLVGYLNGENHGIYGLEKSFDELLFCNNGNEVAFSISANGEFLLGENPNIKYGDTPGYIRLTVDKKIQKICSTAAQKIKKGAIIVTEVKSGKIKAMVSKPSFDVNNISDYVLSTDSPFINRALAPFSVGSVFKPLIAAAMLERGENGFEHTCNGYTDILDIRFFCNNRNGHGKMNLKEALAVSCNTYFYNAASLVSPNILYNQAVSLGFTNSVELANELRSDKGTLTTLEELKKSKANIANFAIGQGNIALSPLVISNLYSAIANGGVYYSPSVVEEWEKDGKITANESANKNIVFSKKTADILKEYLINAVNSGTGKSALPTLYGAGGKTATAQTGQYNNGREILNAWFCGFFPANEPKYVVVVFIEDGSSGGADCGPIFKEIADNINVLD